MEHVRSWGRTAVLANPLHGPDFFRDFFRGTLKLELVDWSCSFEWRTRLSGSSTACDLACAFDHDLTHSTGPGYFINPRSQASNRSCVH